MIERMLDHISWPKESEMDSVELLIVASFLSRLKLCKCVDLGDTGSFS